MPDASPFALFVAAALALLVPGPSILYIVARSVGGGRSAAGLASMTGVTFVTLAFCTGGLYALLSWTAGGWPRRKREVVAFRRRRRFIWGGVLLAPATVASRKD